MTMKKSHSFIYREDSVTSAGSDGRRDSTTQQATIKREYDSNNLSESQPLIEQCAATDLCTIDDHRNSHIYESIDELTKAREHTIMDVNADRKSKTVRFKEDKTTLSSRSLDTSLSNNGRLKKHAQQPRASKENQHSTKAAPNKKKSKPKNAPRKRLRGIPVSVHSGSRDQLCNDEFLVFNYSATDAPLHYNLPPKRETSVSSPNLVFDPVSNKVHIVYGKKIKANWQDRQNACHYDEGLVLKHSPFCNGKTCLIRVPNETEL